MKQPTEWESLIDGQSYAFSHQKVKGKQVLTINGVPQTIKSGFVSSMLGFDEKFDLDGREARLVIEKNDPDVVVNNVFLRSGKTYVQRPAWSMAFIVACLLIPVVSLGGVLPFLFGLGGAAICVSVSKTSMPVAARIALCTIITLLAWVLWFVLIIGINMLT